MVLEFVMFLEIILQLTAVHWSFEFNHEVYTKRCRYPDECTKNLFKKYVKAQQAKKLNFGEYQMLSDMELSAS